MYAQLDQTRLFFDVDGPEWVPDGEQMRKRPVLFLLHGGPGGEHGSFKKTVGKLRDVAQLVYVDHRGSGRTRRRGHRSGRAPRAPGGTLGSALG